jgi:tRNA pseudouridine38-40 synthase
VRYFFHIGFSGINYQGWQRQSNALSVQEVVEATLTKVLKTQTVASGCGRTDAQVHASQFFFHTDIPVEWDYDLLFRMNKMLPDDIAMYDVVQVADGCNARFDATARTYEYFIHTYKDPFLNATSALYPMNSLDLSKMKAAAALLPLYNDYRCLCKSPSAYRTTKCEIASAGWFTDKSRTKFRFQITADRFLSHMIRIIVGKMLEVGCSRLSVDEFESYLAGKAPEVFEVAYPQGLYLSRVRYPYLDLAPKSLFSPYATQDEGAWSEV